MEKYLRAGPEGAKDLRSALQELNATNTLALGRRPVIESRVWRPFAARKETLRWRIPCFPPKSAT